MNVDSAAALHLMHRAPHFLSKSLPQVLRNKTWSDDEVVDDLQVVADALAKSVKILRCVALTNAALTSAAALLTSTALKSRLDHSRGPQSINQNLSLGSTLRSLLHLANQ